MSRDTMLRHRPIRAAISRPVNSSATPGRSPPDHPMSASGATPPQQIPPAQLTEKNYQPARSLVTTGRGQVPLGTPPCRARTVIEMVATAVRRLRLSREKPGRTHYPESMALSIDPSSPFLSSPELHDLAAAVLDAGAHDGTTWYGLWKGSGVWSYAYCSGHGGLRGGGYQLG